MVPKKKPLFAIKHERNQKVVILQDLHVCPILNVYVYVYVFLYSDVYLCSYIYL